MATVCVNCGKILSASEDLVIDRGHVCGPCYSECSPSSDPINPAYYLKGKIEVADFIADQKLDYFEGNVVKYICRWKDKGGVQDLNKIKWYLNKLIDQAVEGER
jgi:hypothetical protein